MRPDIDVRQRVVATAAGSPRAGQTLALSGTVRPARAGTVQLQRHAADGGWTTVAHGALRDGRWTISWRVPRARPTDLRVRVGGRPRAGLAAGLSTVLHLDPR